MLPTTTLEQRQQAAEMRRQRRAEGLAIYKQNWSTESLWVDLANQHGVRLSQSHMPPSVHRIRKFARRIGLTDGAWEQALFGIRHHSLKQAIAYEASIALPGQLQSQRAYEGHLLELCIHI